ncbi:MAG: putative selenium-dependent hydroxylase accessory protein YqeC [Clostridia bacterium]|nr:putative selenium-dependent hydroxylase accessory protein YqeC [Clostridia bacterium]
MIFSHSLDIRPGVTALIGGGGKTSLMLALAGELKEKGAVIICTTTRIYPPEGMPVLSGASREEIAEAVREYGAVCVGEMYGEKLGPPKVEVSELAHLADHVIVEADGAKGMPLKAHASHEPVIPEGARVIYVIGADGIGKPVGEAAHRPELYAERLGVDTYHIVTPEDAAKMVNYGDTVLFNKAESRKDIQNGRRFAEAFRGSTVIASLKNGQVIERISKQ